MPRARKEHTTSLNLVGDGDDEDLVDAIRDSFGFEFGDDELTNVETFGQLYDAVLAHLPNTQPGSRTHCRSALVFRRLRRATRLMAWESVRPSTPLRALVADGNYGRFLDRLESESGLDLGRRALATWTVVPGLAVCVGNSIWLLAGAELSLSRIAMLAVGAIMFGPFIVLTIAATAAAVSNGWGTGISRDLTTLGDLADRTQHLNFGRLAGRSNQNHPKDVWRSLEFLARDASGYGGPIDRATRLIGP